VSLALGTPLRGQVGLVDQFAAIVHEPFAGESQLAVVVAPIAGPPASATEQTAIHTHLFPLRIDRALRTSERDANKCIATIIRISDAHSS